MTVPLPLTPADMAKAVYALRRAFLDNVWKSDEPNAYLMPMTEGAFVAALEQLGLLLGACKK
jgi:hypothetical protein